MAQAAQTSPDPLLSAAPVAPAGVPVVLFTAGYEGEDTDAFVAKLKRAGVDLVIDVRYVPMSRKKGFSKKSMAERMALEGIRYRHLQAAGTPNPMRSDYKQSGDFAALETLYARYLDEHAAALDAIYDLAIRHRAVLVCFEAEAHRCHRSILARRIASTHLVPNPLRVENL